MMRHIRWFASWDFPQEWAVFVVTDDNPGPLLVGGVPLRDRLARQVPALTAEIITRVAGELPAYAAMPSEELAGDITKIIERSIRTFIEVLRTGDMPEADALGAIRESAARRADEGVPVDVVLGAYHIGVQVCLDAVIASAEQEDVGTVVESCRLVLRYLQWLTCAVAAGYFQERQTIFGEEHAAQQTLLSALLEGVPAGEAAHRAGLRLPPRYLVLSLSIGSHPDELRSDVDSSVAARRKLRRLRAELDRHSREPVLSALSPDGGIALLPDDGTGAELSTKDHRWLTELVSRLGKTAGADVLAGVAAAPPDIVAAAATQCRELSELVRRFGRPPGVYRLADLLLEYQLTRPSAARDALAALLDPLSGKPELLDTLRFYLANDLGRRPTAAGLHVHPNTVDYRIRKITSLTGLDLTRPADLARITAALAAHDSS